MRNRSSGDIRIYIHFGNEYWNCTVYILMRIAIELIILLSPSCFH
jgi:hypothetical protein